MRNIDEKIQVLVFAPNGTQLPFAEVRCLRIRDFPRLLSVVDDEGAAAEVYAGKASGWADTLSDESVVAVVEAGEKLNDGFFVPWVQRRIGRAARATSRTDAPALSTSGPQNVPSVAGSPSETP